MNTLNDLNESLIDEIYQIKYENKHNIGYVCKSINFSNDFFQQLKYHLEFENFYDIILCARLPPLPPQQSQQQSSNVNINQTEYEIKAHKIILASSSEYFRAQFTDGFTDSNTKIIYLDINYDILKQIINFIYTGEVIIKDMNTISYLLPAAVLLQINGIINACCSYLTTNLNASNCIGIYDFAHTYGCMKLVKYAEDFFCRHCDKVLQSDEFLNLDNMQLCHLLGRDDLKIPCESIVFKAIIDWVRYNPEKRRTNLDCLFKCVRYHYLPPHFLKEQIKNCDILKFKEAQRMVNNIQNVIEDLTSHKPICHENSRKPNMPVGLYVVGGYQRQSINFVECFKFSTNTWEQCAEMKYARSGIACVTHAFYIYAIGGRNNSSHGNVDCHYVECYDPILDVWKQCAPMSVPRSRAGAAVIDGLIYVCGGAYGTQYHSSVERFCPIGNMWMPVASMLIARIGLGCVVINRLLYAIGGYDGANRLNQVECFNPETNCWQFVAPMTIPRSGVGCTALENHIYVVGGYTAETQLNSVERYDVQTNQWTVCTGMSSPRSALACVTWNGKIFAIGGYTGREFLAKIETYDPKEDKWTDIAPMLSERSGHGAAISIETV
jgi:kelch-like protein 19